MNGSQILSRLLVPGHYRTPIVYTMRFDEDLAGMLWEFGAAVNGVRANEAVSSTSFDTLSG